MYVPEWQHFTSDSGEKLTLRGNPEPGVTPGSYDSSGMRVCVYMYPEDFPVERIHAQIRDDLMLWSWFTPQKITLSNIKAKATPSMNAGEVTITYTGDCAVQNKYDTNKNSFSIELHYVPDGSDAWKFDAMYYSGNN